MKTLRYLFILITCLVPIQAQADCPNNSQISCPADFALQVPTPLTEGDSPFQAIACISTPYSQNMEIQLISSDRSEIMCPQSAVIPSQYTWVSIEMKVLDDLMVDGPINVTLAAGFSGQTITTQILVKDNDQFADATLEIQALTNLFDHTNGRQWKNNNNWIDNNNPCTWHGIVCDNGIAPVSEIRLNDHNLAGELPNTINQLADLKRLFLGHNQLTGSIPDNLYQTRVHILWLSDNAFSGILPQSIGLLSFLQDLNIANNQLTGPLPDTIGNLSRLESLNLSKNRFSGELPQSFSQFTRLTGLDLHDNQFTGSISVIASLCYLKKLDVRDNQFSGKIPDFNDLSNIRTLDLGGNNFDGTFPHDLAQNTRLLRIDIHDTYLSKQLPEWEGTDYSLYSLNLRSNALQGKIPESILHLTNLSSDNLDLRWNALYAESQAVADFIDQKHVSSDWMTTQTIAPANLTATVLSGTSIRLDWTPIISDTVAGGYEIFYAYAPTSSYRKKAETTDKTGTGYTLTQLYTSTTYFFKVRTRSDPHVNNRNIVFSDFSSPLSLTTHSTITTVSENNGSIVPSGLISVPPNTPAVFSIVPDMHYHVADVHIDGVSAGPVRAYTFASVHYDQKIRAFFANESPQLERIKPITFDEDFPPAAIPLTLTDKESPNDLTIRIISDNLELIPDDHIQISGSGTQKYLHLKNAQELSGFGIITVNVSDPLGLTAIRAFSYTVKEFNDPPIAKNLFYKTNEDTEIECLFMGLDIEKDALLYYNTAGPNHGKLTHDVKSDTFTYRADQDYFGRDYIRYQVQDKSKLGYKMSNEASIVMEILPVNDSPVSHAGKDIKAVEGDRVTLDGSKSHDVDDESIMFHWVQTDGPPVALSSPEAVSPIFIAPHILSEAQPLTLVFWLIVSDDDGASSMDDCLIWVDPRDPPIVPFAQIAQPLTPVTGHAPFRVNFQDHSIGIIDSWQWSFGNGYHSNLQHPIYSYDKPGVYSITLQVSGPGGTDSISRTHWVTVLANPHAVSSVIPLEERRILVDLYNNTQGTQWRWQMHWLDPQVNEYYWYGVTVPDNHVTLLQLPENLLDGNLPPDIDRLAHLQQMDLASNKITGKLPHTITCLKNLRHLDLSNNQIADTLPGDLGSLNQLTHLFMNHNAFYGSIPQSIGDIQSLKYFNLSHNQLIGNLPNTFKNLLNLVDLSLSFNQLNGLFPDFIDQLIALEELDLSHNKFMGPIPDSLMRARGLQGLFLSDNQLDGPIPDGFNLFENLQILDLSNNAFTGELPTTFYETPQLAQVNLSGNYLEGPLTSRMTLLKQMIYLNFSHNQFSGILPVELTRLDKLQLLNLSHNAFKGEIPETLSRLIQLRVLDISHNHFKSAFPNCLLTLSKIKKMNLSGNDFSGLIPTDIMQMTWLEDNESDFRWNRLTTDNNKVDKFISSKQIDGDSWINTQTIAPKSLNAKTGETWSELILSWDPIPYTANDGGYEIYKAQHPDGPYDRIYVTPTKSAMSHTDSNLSMNHTYYYKLRTITFPHANNPNSLTSNYTPILPVTVYQLTDRPDNPSNLTAETYMKNRILLQWSDITKPDNVYYHVFRSETIDGRYQSISTVPVLIPYFVDWDVQTGRDYYYKVRSYLDTTPSEMFSEIVHAIPGTTTTYNIDGHFTVALVEQGATADYSMTVIHATGFNGKINMSCIWPGKDQSTPPPGLKPMFYLRGFIMDTEMKRISLPAPIHLKIDVVQDYTPSVVNFQLAVTDNKTQKQRLYGMQLRVIPRGECAIVMSVDKPVYYPFSDICVTGLISSKIPKEPIDIQLLAEGNPLIEKHLKSAFDGYFETCFKALPWTLQTYTINAQWDIWDLDIVCPQSAYSVSIPINISQGISRILLSLKPEQQLPELNQRLDILCQTFPVVNNSMLILRIYAPDGNFVDKSIVLDGQGIFEIPDIVLSQAGLWRFKAYWGGSFHYRSCESNELALSVATPPGRAIILGTGYPPYQRLLPETTFQACKKVYDHMVERGFDSVDIYTAIQVLQNDPLVPDPPLESMEWVDLVNPTSQEFINIITDEFADSVNSHLPLWIYIHGFSESDASIHMDNAYNLLQASQIDTALDELQSKTHCRVIVIVDTPYSGAFIPYLSDMNRVIITSTTVDNYRVDPANDLIFSIPFFQHLDAGNNVMQAFNKSKDVWERYCHVSAQIDDNGNGVANSADGILAGHTFMNGPIIEVRKPVVDKITIAPLLQYATSLPISVSVVAGTASISSVKVKLIDPLPQPLYKDISTASDFIPYTLKASGQPGIYSDMLTCLTIPGNYTLLVVTQDQASYLSEPACITVRVEPDTPVTYFETIPDHTRHVLDGLCGFFTSDDPNFHLVQTPTDSTLRAIWGLDHRNVYAVGDNGTILFFDGSHWHHMESQTQERLFAVWGSSANDIYVTGEKGVIQHYNGSAWESINTNIQNHLMGIWGTSSTNIYAVGGMEQFCTLMAINGSDSTPNGMID
ncbi:MAG: hypothetical protein OMM_02742 [Candidatus Magnetoglobus multicellularis str. Araruama]|uniref:Uncharacterized protein n=1 Tax=Candidatus Magnetoglobus multicellularis str. Araruama TaxID=890399 RepID=A0A1V1P884_9BACT|nr:MAG: hypothetical protein OMM_02742 [Candidatus Magnetoglobus multicellularis str. Araruama]